MTATRYGDVYAALTAAEVPFVVAGDTAVVLQGHPPQERLAWLEQAIELAALSGALARARADKQREIYLIWGTENPP